jgi:hypothetical protein
MRHAGAETAGKLPKSEKEKERSAQTVAPNTADEAQFDAD